MYIFNVRNKDVVVVVVVVVLDLRTSGHFQFKSKLEDSPSKALNYLNLQSLTLRQEQVNAIRNVVENQR